ncbi:MULTISPECIES: DNA (cytosine-5-)-methyltransferase [unclassified Microcystis]|uniref:DNA cytosine methyltransferase n=1 Tax=unclassified Microcystis TaxID=2643300 RepID=UPI00258C6B6F|nr:MULTISPECIES: DNA (cytosine-5-)-methyltransferase [unclassified Microcystis]MCA2762019.1 DNA (cytosine-5-)-methyltransferase [Microcystis sp. M151S2]MCA2642305.1 DNA (cytosine-5-)-methyltransferase [Microcystis sp. M087S2]MCA2672637.1 DNA (cytosine-5-)-methyltransferase [Microcystis sp. M080S2]MCA2688210.1 DNA (cytosine-5-)-methyltransferase [Microcystis sp. M037S2]MCA2732884.1 DNA (cytosine-5-)-methyltransferase [Microcystis sp. M158S2]
MNRQQKRVLSLFSGCGGMDLGLEGDFWVHQDCVNENIHQDWIVERREPWLKLPRTTFETVFANDITKAAHNAWIPYFEKRGKKNVFHLGSIVYLVKQAEKGEFQFPSNIDVVTGGFPCQDFSVSGKRKGFNSHKSHTGKLLDESEDSFQDNRGKLYYWMKRVIELTLPKVFIAENVKGLISLANVKDIIEQDFSAIGKDGYIVIPKLLFAPDYGIPQTRERIIFIGLNKTYLKATAIAHLENNDIFPRPTHEFKTYSTVVQILSGLAEPEDELFDLSQKSYSKAKYYGKTQGQIEVNLQGLSPTIRSEHHGNIEFRRLSLELGGKIVNELEAGLKMRRLTVRECARIQTFPDDFQFVRQQNKGDEKYSLSATDGYKLIGNAVPPLLAYHMAKHLENQWDYLFEDIYSATQNLCVALP